MMVIDVNSWWESYKKLGQVVPKLFWLTTTFAKFEYLATLLSANQRLKCSFEIIHSFATIVGPTLSVV